jgi:hypothetical protein
VKISDNLKKDLIDNMDSERVFQKHVVDGPSHLFNIPPNSRDDEYQLRHELAIATSTSINDVIIVGSAKLGFSVKSAKFPAFDEKFSSTGIPRDKSDVDIAIVNQAHFEKVAEAIYHLSSHFDKTWIRKNWMVNQYYIQDVALFHEYSHYITKGWLRPDFMPNAYLSIASWPEVCEKWRNRLNRTVSIGIYSNWTYLKHYHMDHLETLRAKMKTLEIV